MDLLAENKNGLWIVTAGLQIGPDNFEAVQPILKLARWLQTGPKVLNRSIANVPEVTSENEEKFLKRLPPDPCFPYTKKQQDMPLWFLKCHFPLCNNSK